MALTTTPPGELGSIAPEFALLGVDGKTHRLSDYSASGAPPMKACVIVFMCNHCPYVKAIQGRLNSLAREYQGRGVQIIGINPNDASRYPDDSFDAMKRVAREQGYVFPYLLDDTQAVARAYGAVCTPDFFVYSPNTEGQPALRYRGRLDDSWKDESQVKVRDLAQALDTILADRPVSAAQVPSMGCSIKWK
jgi:peroxiredoxin